MTFDDYQRKALTAASDERGAFALAYFAMGVAGEAGEVVDYVKKVVGHGKPLDRARLQSELGDLLWYLAVLAHKAGLSLNEVVQANLEKLQGAGPKRPVRPTEL